MKIIIKKIGKIIYSISPILALSLNAAYKGFKIKKNNSILIIQKKNKRLIINADHEVYGFDLISDFDYYFSTVISEKIDNYETIDFSEPKKHTLAKSKLDFIFPSLPESQESTQAYIEALNLKEGEVVLDLGSYAGVSSYFISKQIGDNGKVICMEPDPKNFDILNKNIKFHNINNAILLQKGVWSSTGKIDFQTEGNLGSTISNFSNRKKNTTSIDVLCLEDLQKNIGLKIDAIKMDIEGGELNVIKNSFEFFKKNNYPRLVIEPHFVNGKFNLDNICKTLESYGYKIKLVSQGIGQCQLISAFFIK
jgi:FkbM family methyltransferase